MTPSVAHLGISLQSTRMPICNAMQFLNTFHCRNWVTMLTLEITTSQITVRSMRLLMEDGSLKDSTTWNGTPPSPTRFTWLTKTWIPAHTSCKWMQHFQTHSSKGCCTINGWLIFEITMSVVPKIFLQSLLQAIGKWSVVFQNGNGHGGESREEEM